MSKPVIKVENLSKKYVLAHQTNSRGGHGTLRDTITEGFQSISNSFKKQSNVLDLDPGHEDFWALNDISFEIKQGDRVGIIGRNGAGKSTLLKILSRITEPTHGRITIEGRVASLLEVGTGFHAELTGRENIFLNGAILGMSKVEIKRKFDEIVAFSEVEKFLDTPVKRYSSGMYVRLAFAVAAHLEPEILIVDEVLAVGDMEFQKKCLGKMEDISSSDGRTVLFVSHNMFAIRSLCQKCLVLKKGMVGLYGEMEEAVDFYINENTGNIKDNYYKYSSTDNDVLYIDECKIISASEGFSEIGYAIGDILIFRIKIILNIDSPNINIGIGINNSMNERITTLHTDYSSIRSSQIAKGEHVFTCKIEGLYLRPGIYPIKIQIDAAGYEFSLDPALNLYINEKNNFITKTGRYHNGSILCTQSWDKQI
jgi:lipopolysaccharide transport system ATP-binding protein